LGNNPYLEDMKNYTARMLATFCGYLEDENLAHFMLLAIFFIFLSIDTFDNLVLAEQALTPPGIASDSGETSLNEQKNCSSQHLLL
jgi:hypothetical protein